MNEHIRLLDCTLRDGGHLVNGKFGETTIKTVIKRLVEAKVDIIEVGFLWGEEKTTDDARYHTIKDVKRILPKERGTSKFSLMADSVDLSHLEPNDGTIDFIRLSFKPIKTEWAFDTAKILIDKGYQIFINPIYSSTYSDQEYLNMMERVNTLKPYGFSIVDTYGTMRMRDLERRVNLVDYNLDKNIVLGLHLHDNLGLANSLAQRFLLIASPARNIVIDCSLLGMGRAPGNLCIEQIADHLNLEYGMNYDTEPILDAIDDYIYPLKQKTPWGYSVPYFISAKYSLPRSYAEYLIGKSRLKTHDIQRILKSIPSEKALTYDEKYIESLYKDYMGVVYDSSEAFKAIKEQCVGEKVLVIAPGASISNAKDRICAYIEENKPVVFSVNFIPDNIKVNCVLCTNIKRFEGILIKHSSEQIFITSNISQDYENCNYIISYNDIVYHSERYCDDSTVMLLNALQKSGVSSVAIAGFDGFMNNMYGFYEESFEPSRKNYMQDALINEILKRSYGTMTICFLTPSSHEKFME